MSDRKEYLSGDENSRGRGDMGDQGGAKVGRPTPAPREADSGSSSGAGPSSRTVPEGLEGAVLETNAGNRGGQQDEKSTGAGAEAARGSHARSGQDTSTGSGSGEQSGGSPRGGSERLGSEPLAHEREHKGSYGGEGGKPRTSSDTREPQKPD